MPDYSLVPVDHQSDFGDVSLVPVDYDPFSADGATQPAQAQPAQNQPARPPQQPATGPDLPDVGAPLIGDGGQFSPGAPWANKAADIASKLAGNAFHGAINLVATPGAIMQPNPYPPGSEEASWYDDQREQTIKKWAPATAFGMMGAGAPMAERGAVGALGGKLSSPEIVSEELAGQTRSQIRDLATDKGLVPKGDPLHPDYPRKWSDPVTNERRLRLDRGHVDLVTGQPFDIPNAAVDHVHAYDINGNPIEVNGERHIPTAGE
jgi:hypothetical protein